MEPMKHKFKLEIAPAIVAAKVCNTKMLDVPDGCSLVAAAVDLNTSYAATIAIVAFKPDTSSTVIWHDTFPCHID